MNIEVKSSLEQCWAIVPAAGIGSRMLSSIPKQYMPLENKTLIEHSLCTLLNSKRIKGIVVAIAEDDRYWRELSISKNPKIQVVIGGEQRVDSVTNALKSLQGKLLADDFILVHDAARPCISLADLDLLFDALSTTKSGVLLADKLSDTIKRDDGNGAVLKTVPREGLWRALTPQIFPATLLIEALEQLTSDNRHTITDEASAIEALGYYPLLLQGRSDNIKVTKTEDIKLAALILQAQNNSTR